MSSGTPRTGGPVPKYERLRRALAAAIGALGDDAALPTERELAVQHGVSRATVRQALEALEAAGLVYRVQGAGTYVAPRTVAKTLSLTSFSEDMRAKGLTPGSRVVVVGEAAADHDEAADLAVGTGTPLLRLVRVRLADSAPMCVETSRLVAARVPGLAAMDLTGSLYALLAEHFEIRPRRADQAVRSVVTGEEQSALLGIASRSPALRVDRVSYDERGAPVESTTSLYRADRYEIRFAVHREAP
ncbi:GntR family transcriptional regulator [Murinocardiopsis flavida]|uniref:GntR family transcriptional regulator n=1 Tax=Murinocardiopsis flavida TaxID=645275 RepID=A0A2P8CXH9_9ACTN|nr:GntR family transcriptional regulator [Murinocardiopsis flavida]PSK89684.1 GntR family transcriptional regulator [Murinocardiopsis flavida]